MHRPNRTPVKPLEQVEPKAARLVPANHVDKFKRKMLGEELVRTNLNISQRQADILEAKATRKLSKSAILREALDAYFEYSGWIDKPGSK